MSHMIGVVTALPSERKTLSHLEKSTQCVRVVCAGMGPDNAEAATQQLIQQGCRQIVSWGMAGALNPSLLSGDVVHPARVLDAESGNVYDVDSGEADTLLVSTAAVANPEDKQQLTQSGAQAVDMESSSIAQVCREQHISFRVIRAIADPLGAPWLSTVSQLLDMNGRLRIGALLTALLTRPHHLWAAAQAQNKALSSLRQSVHLLKVATS